MMLFLVLCSVLISSTVLTTTGASRLKKIEDKLTVLELKVTAYSIEMSSLKNEVTENNRKLELILNLLNGTNTGPLESENTDTVSEGEIGSNRRVVPKELDKAVRSEISRVRRAFVAEKKKLSLQHRRNNVQFLEFAERLNDTISSLQDMHDTKWTLASDSINESLTSLLDNVRDDITIHLNAWNETIHDTVNTNSNKTQVRLNTLDTSILRWNDTINKSLGEVSQNIGNVMNKSLIRHVESTNQIQQKMMSTLSKINNTVATMDYKANLGDIINTLKSVDDKTSRLFFKDKFIRLVNGSNGSYGRLEVFINGTWGTVCDDDFKNAEATVACRMLGFKSGTYRDKAFFGQGTGPTLMDNVACKGTERSLFECSFITSVHEDCGHQEDVGVICTN